MPSLNPVMVQAELRQGTEPQWDLGQSLSGHAQDDGDGTTGVEPRGSLGDANSLSHPPPTHPLQPATLSLPSLEGPSIAPLFMDPLDAVPSIDASCDMYNRHEDRLRGSTFEDRGPHSNAASTDIARDDPTDIASVDSNGVRVETRM